VIKLFNNNTKRLSNLQAVGFEYAQKDGA